MGKKNQYSFSKRQREIKKRKKAEEKRERKLAKKEGEEILEGAEVDEFGNVLEPGEAGLAETDEERQEGEA